MKVHPFADRWPMMTVEELNDLADDILANGLVHPIVTAIINDEEMLIDGRNRLAACKRAGIEPRYQRLNGQDPIAYIISSNAARRQMTKGALAMVVATQYPDADEEVGGRGKKSVVATRFPMVTTSKLSHARTVIANAPELVDAVITGQSSLDGAYSVACARKRAAETDDEKMRRLLTCAADLADRVKEDGMDLNEAIAALDERERALVRIREGGKNAAKRLAEFCSLVTCIQQAHDAGERDLIERDLIARIIESVEVLKRME